MNALGLHASLTTRSQRRKNKPASLCLRSSNNRSKSKALAVASYGICSDCSPKVPLELSEFTDNNPCDAGKD